MEPNSIRNAQLRVIELPKKIEPEPMVPTGFSSSFQSRDSTSKVRQRFRPGSSEIDASWRAGTAPSVCLCSCQRHGPNAVTLRRIRTTDDLAFPLLRATPRNFTPLRISLHTR